MQSQAHPHMCDNGHEIGDSSSSNAESSETNPSEPKSSMRVAEVSTTSSITGTPAASGSHLQSSRKHSYTHKMTKDSNHNQNQSNSPDTPNINKNQFLLEQQIKLTQLHQLQQLQHHIFQQQMALISGQSTPMNTILSGSTSSELVGLKDVGSVGSIGSVGDPNGTNPNQQQNLDGETQSGPHAFSGLPTPAHSGEIRPVDYNTASPPMINLIGSLNLQHMEPLPNSMIPSSNLSIRSPTQHPIISHRNSNTSQRYGHRLSSSLSSPSVHLQNNRQDHTSYPSPPLFFDQNSTLSPTFHPISPMYTPISHPYHRPTNSHHSSSRKIPHLPQSQLQVPRHLHTSSSPSTPIASHSEGFEFNIFGVNRSGGSVHATPYPHSSNTSPNILGSDVAFINGPSGGRGFGHAQQLSDLDQDISPLTSPWLGATVSASGGTAVSTSVQLASNATGALIKKVETSQAHSRKTSISGNKRTASDSGDEGDAWSRGGTNRNSKKRAVLGSGGRTGSFSGSVGSNAAFTPGLVGSEKEKGGEKEFEKKSGSTSPLTGTSTSPVVSSPMATSATLARDPTASGGSGNGHLNGGSSHTTATSLVTSTAGFSIPSKGTRRGSRSTSSTSTPLLRSTPSTTSLLSPSSPFLAVGGGTGLGRREGRSNQGQGQEPNSPSPVDLNLEVGQGQDRRSMPPPPLPRGGVDVDMDSTEPTSPMDDPNGHLQHGMLSMGDMGFDNMMSLDEGMSVGMSSIGMGGLGGMGLDGMSGMDMGSMSGIGGMSMEEMGDMGMNVNMGGMAGFGNDHEDSHHLERGREELSMMGMGYGRDNDEEGIQISSSSSSTTRRNASMGLATHQQHRPQSHLQPHSEYQQPQPHLSPAKSQHPRPLSHQHSLQSPQTHELPTEQSLHHLQSQVGQPTPANLPNQQQPTMPVATPSSILNLGRVRDGFGGRLGSASSASTSMGAALNTDGIGMTTRGKKGPKSSKDTGGPSITGGASRKRSMTTSMVGQTTGTASPAIRPLKPTAAVSESALPSPELRGSIGSTLLDLKTAASGVTSTGSVAGLTGGGSITATPILGPADAIGIRQPKRTHRDAEQRRRNSQKQVIDELRRLLPPIALPSDANNNGDPDFALGLPGTSPFFFQPIATLLPGGLPPRGPPKVGGEGPNKGVSKLQVLLCGNEYIKMLKARVDRRDEEIGRLRREVKRLRGDEEMVREEEELDLERDLDAVERLQTMNGKGAGSSVGECSVQGSGSSMGRGGGSNDAMEDDEDDGDG